MLLGSPPASLPAERDTQTQTFVRIGLKWFSSLKFTSTVIDEAQLNPVKYRFTPVLCQPVLLWTYIGKYFTVNYVENYRNKDNYYHGNYDTASSFVINISIFESNYQFVFVLLL